MHVLLGLYHLCCAVYANHCSQFLSIILGVEHSTSPSSIHPIVCGLQHVTNLTVEVGVCWQLIENEVPNAFYCIPFVEVETLSEQ